MGPVFEWKLLNQKKTNKHANISLHILGSWKYIWAAEKRCPEYIQVCLRCFDRGHHHCYELSTTEQHQTHGPSKHSHISYVQVQEV